MSLHRNSDEESLDLDHFCCPTQLSPRKRSVAQVHNNHAFATVSASKVNWKRAFGLFTF